MTTSALVAPPVTRTVTAAGLRVERTVRPAAAAELDALLPRLDRVEGGFLGSDVEVPGRYGRWLRAFAEPCLRLDGRDRRLTLTVRTPAGRPLLAVLARALDASGLCTGSGDTETYAAVLRDVPGEVAEESRTRRPSLVSLLRVVTRALSGPDGDDPWLGVYGAFGYDLGLRLFGLDPVAERAEEQRELALFLPDRLLVGTGPDDLQEVHYRFTDAAPGPAIAAIAAADPVAPVDPPPARPLPAAAVNRGPEAYRELVRRALAACARGDVYEIVLSQTIAAPARRRPSEVLSRLRGRNPSPYGFLLNLGLGEVLVGASPEMFVRCTGDRVESAPISGTTARGGDPVEDAARIQALLDSEKEAAELTMCTDVDRNDKARVCRPGSVRVVNRRQLDAYQGLVHTVDQVEGTLRDGFDGWDAFLTHLWAATVTGAPKPGAMRLVEEWEDSPRGWYGGAVGYVTAGGEVDTGLTLRTVRLVDGVAEVRAGATLLIGSDPEAEEAETRLKASAVLRAVLDDGADPDATPGPAAGGVLVLDHEDSFVQSLADYFRQAGCATRTVRWDARRPLAVEPGPGGLLVLSPGPGRPERYRMAEVLAEAVAARLPVFGVGLGLAAIVEFFGGGLGHLPAPVHGRESEIEVVAPPAALFAGLPTAFPAARYHSMTVRADTLPSCLRVTATTADGLVMAVEHRDLPIAAVQFHPESLLTSEADTGLRLVRNAVTALAPLTQGG